MGRKMSSRNQRPQRDGESVTLDSHYVGWGKEHSSDKTQGCHEESSCTKAWAFRLEQPRGNTGNSIRGGDSTTTLGSGRELAVVVLPVSIHGVLPMLSPGLLSLHGL